jgi:hypothetical protein
VIATIAETRYPSPIGKGKTMNKNESVDAASLHPIVSRAELERAWLAYGFMAFCGTVHDTKIGVIARDFPTLGRGYKAGDVVFYREYETALSVERPHEAERLGKSGFIAGVGTTVGVPKQYVLPIDPRAVVEIG